MFVRPPYSEVDASPAAGLKTTEHLRLPKLADGAEPASLPPDDDARVVQLRSFCVLDSNKDPRFDRITRLTSELLDVPIVLVSLVDTSREWFKSAVGTDLSEIARAHGFCAHALLLPDNEVMKIVDTLEDTRFATHPFVAGGPKLRFYCGAPIVSASGHTLGMLCVHDTKPRPDFDFAKMRVLAQLAAIVMDEIDFNRIETERAILVAELSHRVKNVLSVVKSVAQISARGNAAAAPFVAAFSERLSAMAAAQDQLLGTDGKDVDLGKVVMAVVAAHQHQAQNSGRIVLQLPKLALDASFAQSVALLVHELLTNAIKYGALNDANGHVDFTAERRAIGGIPSVAFTWRETGGPAPLPPSATGFGHRLLEMVVRQKQGTVDLDWQPTGLVCRFAFPEHPKI